MSEGKVKKDIQIDEILETIDIDDMKIEEKVDLFQQIEILQGVRVGQIEVTTLSPSAIEVINACNGLKTKKKKNEIGDMIKRRLFDSIKASIS